MHRCIKSRYIFHGASIFSENAASIYAITIKGRTVKKH